MILILGPTAVGKTTIAANLAFEFNGEVISADSRQVYKGLDIGSGKDLEEYVVNEKSIPYHLINICDPYEEYNVFRFQHDFYASYHDIIKRDKTPILCGGTGLYLEAALAKKQYIEVPENLKFREKSKEMSLTELQSQLLELTDHLHNKTDLRDRDRIIRAIEIEQFKQLHPQSEEITPIKSPSVFGIKMERSKLRDRIKERLDDRLKNGMIEEVEGLIESGVSLEQLKWFGLEYKYISTYLANELTYSEMYEKLLQAIRRFAKKQMTWFRRMERKGVEINWIDAALPLAEKLNYIKKMS